MKTLYDIGDEIEIRMRGVIKEYSVSESGDCYIIKLKNTSSDTTNRDAVVYLSSDDLRGRSNKVSGNGFDPAERFLFE
jgi:hypothetical protein